MIANSNRSVRKRICWQPLGRGDTRPLAPDQLRNQQQREEAHEHAEDAKGLRRSALRDPLAHEKGPREGDDGAEDGAHHEGVA